MMEGEHIKFPSAPGVSVTTGNVGLQTHIPGACVTVSAVASATGGIRPGGLIETDR